MKAPAGGQGLQPANLNRAVIGGLEGATYRKMVATR